MDKKENCTELYFMVGSIETFKDIDFKTDWRFCAVKDKRSEAILVGDINLVESDWPIKFPITLNNGIIIND